MSSKFRMYFYTHSTSQFWPVHRQCSEATCGGEWWDRAARVWTVRPGGPELKGTSTGRSLGPELNREKEFWIKTCIPASSSPKPGIQTTGLLILTPSSHNWVLLRHWKKQMQFEEQNKNFKNHKLQRTSRIHSIHKTIPGYSKHK